MSNPNLDTEVEQQVYLAARRALGDDVEFDSQLEEQVYNAMVEAGVGGGGGGGGSSPLPANTVPYAPGTAAVGTSARYARADHVHPLQDSAAKLTTARNLTVSDYDASHTGVATPFDGSGNATMKMPSMFKGTLRGNADAATKLANARKLKTDLASTTDATFDGSTNQEAIPITGILPVTHGGTGVTAVADIQAGKDVDGNAIKTTYAKLDSPAFIGTPSAPTPNKTTDSTQIATTAFVHTVVTDALSVADAMNFKGTVAAATDLPTLPNVENGWSYKATDNFSLGGVSVISGALIVALVEGDPATLTWEVVQTNGDGSVTGPSSSVDADIAIFAGTAGNVLADSGKKVENTLTDDTAKIPTSHAVYDALPDPYTGTAPIAVDATTNKISISDATTTTAGSMSAADKTKLDGIVAMTGATASADGTSGLVPAPSISDKDKFLKGDGTWANGGAAYTASAPISIDANNDISVADATANSKGVVKIASIVTNDSSRVPTSAAVYAAIQGGGGGGGGGVAYLIETWHNQDYTQCYRIYSDGWCEQYGFIAATTSDQKVSVPFNKSYAYPPFVFGKNYINQASTVNWNMSAYTCGIGDITTTGFKCSIGRSNNGGQGLVWKAEGYIDLNANAEE